MFSTRVTITNPQGLHMRPAYLLAETASKFDASIELVKDDIRVDGKSVLGILTLGAAQGTDVVVEARSRQARSASSIGVSFGSRIGRRLDQFVRRRENSSIPCDQHVSDW